MQPGPRLIGLYPQLSTCMDVERNTPEAKRGPSRDLQHTPEPLARVGPRNVFGRGREPGPVRHLPQFSILPRLPATRRPKFGPRLPARRALSWPPCLAVPSAWNALPVCFCPPDQFLLFLPEVQLTCHRLSGACSGPHSRTGRPVLHHLMAKTQG